LPFYWQFTCYKLVLNYVRNCSEALFQSLTVSNVLTYRCTKYCCYCWAAFFMSCSWHSLLNSCRMVAVGRYCVLNTALWPFAEEHKHTPMYITAYDHSLTSVLSKP